MAFRHGRPFLPVAAVMAALALAVAACPAVADDDPLQTAADAFVRTSDRYMHHTRLRRGMRGYGLTVMAGTKVERFDVEIVSVVPNWSPHRSVILALLKGPKYQITGVVAGMSGSPIFVRDTDGKDKMIGALAYGWSMQKRPLCGIQPIAHMLTLKEVAEATGQRKAAPPAAGKKPAPKAAGLGGGDDAEFLRQVLDPHKRDFAALVPLPAAAAASDVPGLHLVPLRTPLMVSGLSTSGLKYLNQTLAGSSLMPVASGGIGPAQAEAARSATLEPGGALSVPLVTGDADMTGVGTVTEVIGKRVIGFGHSMFADGKVSMPMGPGYIHTVVAGLSRSFKLGSTARITGTLDRDEEVGVSGQVGPKLAMVDVKIDVEWVGTPRRRTYRYQVARHKFLMARLIQVVIFDSAYGWRAMPELHTVTHDVEVEFEKLGVYRASNVSTGMRAYEAASDAVRPIAALMDNPYAKAPPLKRVHVRMRIEPVNRLVRLERFRLDSSTFRPGEMVTGEATVRPYRGERKTIRLGMRLPADLPEGRYTLTICDDVTAMSAVQRERPYAFRPRTVEQLYDSLRRTVSGHAERIYLRIPLPDRGGTALKQTPLPEMPASRADILAQAERLDTTTYKRSLVASVPCKFVFRGSGTVSFDVRRNPQETLTRESQR